MIDFELLTQVGTTNNRLREICTVTTPADINDRTDEEQEKNKRDMAFRKELEKLIGDRLAEQIQFNLSNYSIYSAVDLAWDSTPINKASVPLMLYAQGKLDMGKCATSLEKAGFGQYVSKNPKGEIKNIDLPKFYEVNVNLIRSVITRRLAAQRNKYNNLFPYYKYEARDYSPVGELRGDVMSQVAEMVVDGYDYRHHDGQVDRDMFMYGHCVDFVRCSWEKEMAWVRKQLAEELKTDTIEYEAKAVKEGVAFVNPHPSRVFWDNAYPLPSINSDSGCEYIGFWDVMRYRDAKNNTSYWNRENVTFSSNVVTLFSTYANYFTQYYCVINAPKPIDQQDMTGFNDRSNNIGKYAGTEDDSSMIIANYFMKLKPKEWGIGDYPFAVWVRFVIGGDNTILFAEIMPSTPCAVASYNENDNRQLNISMAHELMGYQDQMTNLLSYLLLVLQANNFRVLVVDTDLATPDQITGFRVQLKGESAYTGTTVLEISSSKLRELGINDPTKVLQLVETKTTGLDIVFRAIGQLVQLVDRMMALSPQEQGQPAPREISATETNLIAGTTESVYGYISDAIDEFRAAKKRILYESYMALGNQDIQIPVLKRYPRTVVEKAGFKVDDDLSEMSSSQVEPETRRFTVVGTKDKLEHNFVFTGRDGAERPVNTQAANALVQLFGVVSQNPAILAALGKEKLYMIINEIFRKSGVGVDLNLELQPGEDNALMPGQDQELQKVLEGITGEMEAQKQMIMQLQQAVEQATGPTQAAA